MPPSDNPSNRPKLHMIHPRYPRVTIPATRLLGVGLHQAVPAGRLKLGDSVVLDYKATYKISFISERPKSNRLQLNLVRFNENVQRIVSPNTHVAVSWGTFNKRWSLPTSVKTMAKTGKKINLSGKQLDLKTPIDSGVSFHGRVDLTKQGGRKKKY